MLINSIEELKKIVGALLLSELFDECNSKTTNISNSKINKFLSFYKTDFNR
jgi:hypothetical protein